MWQMLTSAQSYKNLKAFIKNAIDAPLP